METTTQNVTLDQILDHISQKTPPVVTRIEASRLCGGAISVKSLANMDCEGTGITPRLRIGGKVAYPRDAFILFLRQRTRLF